MGKEYKLKILSPAQSELEEIARVRLELVGSQSARKITDRVYSALSKLKTFPELGVKCKDTQLSALGYRMLICGNYLCFYRKIGDTVFVYHIADGRTDYPKLFSEFNGASDE